MTQTQSRPGAPPAFQERTLTWFAGIMVAIMVAGIPWAFSLHGRLAAIETKLDGLEVPPGWFKRDVDELQERVDDIENRLRVVEVGMDLGVTRP